MNQKTESKTMGPQFLIAAFVATLGIIAEPVTPLGAVANAAGDCHAKARETAQETGGQLLSAEEKGGQCVVTVLVPQSDGPPKKVTQRFSDY